MILQRLNDALILEVLETELRRSNAGKEELTDVEGGEVAIVVERLKGGDVSWRERV
jgi:hypothetical protein